MEYQVGQLVVHRRDGLATIVNTTSMNGNDFYIVHLNRGEDNIYVPFATASNIIRPLLTVEEADDVLRGMKSVTLEYNTNTKQRRDAIKKRLSSGLVEDIAFLTRQLFIYHRFVSSSEEVKLGPVDVEMLTFASNMFMDELAVVYQKDKEEILSFVHERVEAL